jgi:ATP-binding cassette, subfamily B (MDR/TAP), member 6
MWVLDTLQTLIIQIGLLAGCLLCAKRIVVDQVMSVGDFVLFLSYVTQLYGPLGYFGSYYKTIQKNFVDIEKLMDLFEENTEERQECRVVGSGTMELLAHDSTIEFRICTLTR